MNKKLLILAGDGIGPEVTNEAKRIAEYLSDTNRKIEISEGLVGGASYGAHGTPLTDDTLQAAKTSDAVLLGAVGGPKWDDVARDKRPEAGLLNLRTGMDVFANLRPAFCFPALASASSLKPELVEGLDILIVRELVGGVYFGTPRGIETLENGDERAIDTQVYTTPEIERIADVAFNLARGRSGRVVSAEKANVMETGVLWRRVVSALHEAKHSDIELSHMYADNCAMQLCRAPKQFDVIVTDNLFGDILSDEAAMLTGSIGLLPSASLSYDGKPGLYEPVHGSAPDIAGQGIANPLAAILSLEMAIRWSFGWTDMADRLREAVEAALQKGARSADLGGSLNTQQMADAVLAEL